MKILEFTFLLIFISILNVQSQTKEDLKKKYENSDLNSEIDKKLRTNNIYPDSIILAPLHYTNSFYILDSIYSDLKSISMDITIENEIPNDYYFYISPFNFSINEIPIYCGMQTKGGGKSIKSKTNENIAFNGIFSRWFERTHLALKTEGFYESSDHEGDFIGVRNYAYWNKGKYRLTLKKEDYVPGKSVKGIKNSNELYFSWGEYEHTWVTYTIENLETQQISIIGSLAFPGKKLKLSNYITSFTEQYGYYIDFAHKKRENHYLHYKDIPYVKLTQSNLRINNEQIILKNVNTDHNRTHHPDQNKIPAKMPVLSTATYNSNTGELTIETGKFIEWSK